MMLAFFGVSLVTAFFWAVGFKMGRAWERIPDCPFPGECSTCDRLYATTTGTVHLKSVSAK